MADARARQPAGGAVMQCQAQQPGKPRTFCDVDRIELTVGLEEGAQGGRVQVVSNTLRTAWASAPAPLAPETEAYQWLTRYSAVIALETDFSAGQNRGGGGPEKMAGSRKGRASVKTAAAERCGFHPAVSPYSDKIHAQRGMGSSDLPLELSAIGFDYTEFLTRVWRLKNFSDLVSPATAEQTFFVGGCGAPSSGRGRGAFTALARVTARDDWRIEYNGAAGFSLKFSLERSRTNYWKGDGRSATSSSASGSIQAGESRGSYSSSTATHRAPDGSSYSESAGAGSVRLVGKDAVVTGKLDAASAAYSGGMLGDPIVKQRFGKALDRIEEQFAGNGDDQAQGVTSWLRGKTAAGQPALRIVRNGEELSTGDIAGMIKRVEDSIEAVQTAAQAIGDIARAGVKAAAPATVTASFSFDLKLFAGTARFRHWRAPTAPIRGPAYYVETSESRWTLGLHMTLATGSLTLGIEGQVKLGAAWIASGTLSLEAKLSGKAEVGFDVGRGEAPVEIKGDGWYGATVTGQAEITAVAYYATVQVQVQGGVRYRYRARFDGKDIVPQQAQARSQRTTLSLTIRRGNKLREFFGFGESEKYYEWPKEGPLIILDDDRFVKDFL